MTTAIDRRKFLAAAGGTPPWRRRPGSAANC